MPIPPRTPATAMKAQTITAKATDSTLELTAMPLIPQNLFAGIQGALPEELVQVLLQSGPLRIERIVSRGHASPDGFWYDQEQCEWVLLLSGRARLRFEGHDPLELTPGSFVNIPAHTRHRVDWTDPAEPTLWLAVHY